MCFSTVSVEEQLCPQTHASTPQNRPKWELADVFRLYGDSYRHQHPLPAEHLSVMHLIEICRTAALGGHIYQCDNCGYQLQSYNSCRNRHCPKCQTLTKEQWLQDRKDELIPTGYFHVVFTLPHELNPLILRNKHPLLNLLITAVSNTLQAFAADPQWRMEGQLGFIAVLHTWNQKLLDHFHLHCIVPAGVLQNHSTWKPTRSTYLFKVGSLAKHFRREYLKLLAEAYHSGTLIFPGTIASLADPETFSELLDELSTTNWIVYAKPPFAGPEQLLNYLGRYTHRVAISNHRILSIHNGQVTFSYKDRSDHDQVKLLTLHAHEFIRRFLLHVLPSGFMKIRHFGFLANGCKNVNLRRIREQLGVCLQESDSPKQTIVETMLRLTGVDITLCPRCGKGLLAQIASLPSVLKLQNGGRERFDSS